jgi:tight adherence protein C
MADLQPQFIAALAFLGVSIPLYLLFARYAGRNRAVLQRIDELSKESADSHEQDEQPHGIKRLLGATASRIASRLLPGDDDKRTRLQKRMLHAGLYSRSAVHLFVTVRLLLMVLPVPLGVAAGAFGLIQPKLGLLGGAVAGCAGMVLPGFWLDRRKTRRQLILGRSLPDFLDLLVTCLESGLSLDAALRRVTSELRFAHAVLAVEMDRVQTEIDLGANADTALHNLAERTDMESVHTLGTFIHQARKYGTSISDALRTHGEMLREQREQRAEEKAQKAAVKILFPTLLFIFPAIFVVLAGPAAIQLNENLANQDGQQIQSTNP